MPCQCATREPREYPIKRPTLLRYVRSALSKQQTRGCLSMSTRQLQNGYAPGDLEEV